MHYYVVGVNGSGKTTLLKAVSEHTGIAYVHGTAELMSRLGVAGDYDALRKLNQTEVLDEWEKTAGALLDTYVDKPFLLDTHILNLTNGKVIRRDGPWIQNYDVLVLITAPMEDVLRRLAADSQRERALFPLIMTNNEKLRLMAEYQKQTKQLFYELAERYHLPALEIENKTDHLDQAVRQFIAFHG